MNNVTGEARVFVNTARGSISEGRRRVFLPLVTRRADCVGYAIVIRSRLAFVRSPRAVPHVKLALFQHSKHVVDVPLVEVADDAWLKHGLAVILPHPLNAVWAGRMTDPKRFLWTDAVVPHVQ